MSMSDAVGEDQVDLNTQTGKGGGESSFAGNAFWMLLSELVAKLSSFALVVMLARGLGREQYGHFNFAVSFVPLFLMLGTWGVDIAAVREIARDRSRVSAIFASGLVMRGSLGLIALAASAGIGILFVEGRDPTIALVTVGCALFIDEISRFVGTVFKAFERMRFHATVIMVNRVLSTALSGIALALGASLAVVSITYLVGSAGALVFAAFALRRYFPPIRLSDADRSVMRELFREGAPIGAASVLNMVTFRLDAVLLRFLRGPVAVGLYGVAYRFLESFLFVVWSFSNVVLPRMVRSEDRTGAVDAFQLALAIVLAFYLPLALGAPFAAEWVVVKLFSARFATAGTAVMWLTGALVFYGIAYLSRIGSIALGKRRGITWIAVAALVTNVALNVALIPREGFVGASIATFITEVLEAALLLGLFLTQVKTVRLSPLVVVPVIASGAMAALLMVTGVRGGGAVLLGAATYLGGLVLGGRALAPTHFRAAVDLVRRRKDRSSTAGV